jgi:Uma2 family endonuclease
MTAHANLLPLPRGNGLWSADRFLEFYMSRPDEERWQLVDGLAMMVVPATLPHQRIAKNLLLLLEAALQRARPDLETFYELGVRVPGIDDFNPEPDLIVIEAQTSFE